MPAKKPSTSEAVGDYLKALLELSGAEDSAVSTNTLAEMLGVRTPSVTGMLQKLAAQKPALIAYQKHRGARLTATGKRRAWELVRHHRLLELFLHDVLKYSWDEVHEEAERLEHFISERFEDRIAAILGYPEIDPHGHIIPRKHENGAFRNEVPLADWPPFTPCVVSSVSDRDSGALREFDRIGLRPGTRLRIQNKSARAYISIELEERTTAIRISEDMAAKILVSGICDPEAA